MQRAVLRKPRISVRPSVRPSVKHVHGDKTNETCALLPIFWHEICLVGGDPLLIVPEILGQTDHVVAKTPIFNRYSLVALQPPPYTNIKQEAPLPRRAQRVRSA